MVPGFQHKYLGESCCSSVKMEQVGQAQTKLRGRGEIKWVWSFRFPPLPPTLEENLYSSLHLISLGD